MSTRSGFLSHREPPKLCLESININVLKNKDWMRTTPTWLEKHPSCRAPRSCRARRPPDHRCLRRACAHVPGPPLPAGSVAPQIFADVVGAPRPPQGRKWKLSNPWCGTVGGTVCSIQMIQLNCLKPPIINCWMTRHCESLED